MGRNVEKGVALNMKISYNEICVEMETAWTYWLLTIRWFKRNFKAA